MADVYLKQELLKAQRKLEEALKSRRESTAKYDGFWNQAVGYWHESVAWWMEQVARGKRL